MLRRYWTLTIFVLLAFAQATISAEQSDEQYIKEQDALSKKMGQMYAEVLGRDVVGVWAAKLVKEYVENPVRADSRYKGKLLCVCGEFERLVAKNGESRAYVVLRVPDVHEDFATLAKYKILGRYNKINDPKLLKLESDDLTNLLGVCIGLHEILSDTCVCIDDCDKLWAEFANKSYAWEAKKKEEEKAEKVADAERQAADAKLAAERRAMAEKLRAKDAAIRAEAAQRKREAAADGMLRIAKKFTSEGKDSLGKEWLTKLVKKYPNTDAAKEAGELLKKMK